MGDGELPTDDRPTDQGPMKKCPDFAELVRPVERNDQIRVPNVRLKGEDGEYLGIISTDEAREYARSRNLDLVVVAAQADPPVAQVMDYEMDYEKYRDEQEQKAKHRYEQKQKAKAAREQQQKAKNRNEQKQKAKAAREHQSQTNVKGPMKKCPDCAELVQPEARICRFCRFEFVTATQPAPREWDPRGAIAISNGTYAYPNLVCPHCQTKDSTTRRPKTVKEGISGAKATGALMSAGLSLYATGLSKKKQVAEFHCYACGTVWTVG